MWFGFGCLIVYALYSAIKGKPKYVDTPFARRRREYFRKTGLNKSLPKGRWKWK